MGNTSQSYGADLAIWDHIISNPSQVNAPRLNSNRQVDSRLTSTMEKWKAEFTLMLAILHRDGLPVRRVTHAI